MKPQNLKQCLLQNWNSCRAAVCIAAAKISGTTKALLRDWKRSAQLTCVAISASAVLGVCPVQLQASARLFGVGIDLTPPQIVFASLDPSTGEETALTNLNNVNYAFHVAAAMDTNSHKMYMEADKEGNIHLVSFDTTNGNLTDIAILPLGLDRFVFDSTTGMLFGFKVTVSGTVFASINPNTGEETILNTAKYLPATEEPAFALVPNTHTMYMELGDTKGAYLAAVNTTTGAVTPIATPNIFLEVFAFDPNSLSLFGLIGNGKIGRMNPKTGQTTVLSNHEKDWFMTTADAAIDSSTYTMYLQVTKGDGPHLIAVDTVTGLFTDIALLDYGLTSFELDSSGGEPDPSAVSPKNCGAPPCPRAMAGNPINTATGNKFHAETDFVGAPNTHLTFQRFYNSQGTGSTTFGANWRSTWHSSIAQADSTTLKVARADGRVDTFTLSSGAWTSDPDVTSKLTALDGGGWKLVTPDDSTELYSFDGRLLSITTRAGLVTTLTYDGSNRLTTVTGPFGHTLTFTYDGSNRISQVTQPDGLVISCAYDANNNLTSVTYPGGAVRQYLYENASFPHALTGIIDENGNRFATYAYDDKGRAISTEHAGGAQKVSVAYDTDKATVTDALGNEHSYDFTTLFDLVKPTATTNKGCASCSGSAAYTYDQATGFLTSRTDFNGNTVTYTRDTRGLELSRTEAYGTALARTITTKWHKTFRLPTKITEPGRVATFAYDANGNLKTKTVKAGTKTSVWKYTYNANGQILTATGPLNDVTTYDYGSQGNLAKVTNTLGHATNITSYDANGRPLTIQDPNGLVTTLAYDARGRVASRAVGTETTAYAYDAAGNLTKVTLPDGTWLVYTYDAAHRLAGITDKAGNRIAYTLDLMGNRVKEEVFDPSNALKQTRSYVYDELNRLSQEIGAKLQTTTYGYDSNGNLTSVTDPLDSKTANAYDALNRLVQTTDPNGGVTKMTYNKDDLPTSVTDPRGLKTTYAYDGMGNPTSIKSPDSGTTKKTYDAAGNVTTSTDARGKKTAYTYDKLGRLTKVKYADGKTVTYQYDQGANGLGHLTKMTDPSGWTTWNYDQHGRLTQKVQKTGTATLTTAYTYSATGKLASMTYPSGRQVDYWYNSIGLPNVLMVEPAPLIALIEYQPFGPPANWVQGYGGSTYYSRDFDLDGRIADISIGSNASESIAFTRDDAGRITAMTSTTGAAKTFDYDKLSRLTEYASGATTQNYAYDANGNRTALTTNTGTTAYQISAANNRLASQTYDAAGNLSSDGANAYVHGADGRLAEATAAGVTTKYLYNGQGQRVKKTGGGSTTLFAYDEAGNLIGEYNAKGKPVLETVWANGQPVGVLKPGKLFYVNTDHLGAPRSIENTSGNVVWKWESDPFGNGAPNEKPGSAAKFTYNLRFPGQYFDKETGLHYNYYRDYDPAMGRYIQSDPIGLDAGINTYVYVGGNPVDRVDPSGLNWPWGNITPAEAQALAVQQQMDEIMAKSMEPDPCVKKYIIAHNDPVSARLISEFSLFSYFSNSGNITESGPVVQFTVSTVATESKIQGFKFLSRWLPEWTVRFAGRGIGFAASVLTIWATYENYQAIQACECK